MNGGLIDLENWKRAEHFRLFREFAAPFFNITVEADVTALWNRCVGEGRSFFVGGLWAAVRAGNEVEAMRLRLRPDGVWRHESIGITSTIRRSDDTFGFARAHPSGSFEQFEGEMLASIEAARRGEREITARETDDVIYHSTLPWIRFTSFSNALRLGTDSIPRIVYGKCVEENGRRVMPVAVEVHHALVDGIDVAKFLERFEAALQEPLV